MSKKKYTLERGTQIGALYKEFYTNKNKEKKIRLKGYILLGIFHGTCSALEITLYETQTRTGKKMYIIKSGTKHIGSLTKEWKVDEYKRKYHYLYGSIKLGGYEIRIVAYPTKQTFKYFKKSEQSKSQKAENPIPDYNIELAQGLNFGVVKVV